MTQTSRDQLLSAVRYLLMFAGGVLAAKGYIKNADVDGLVTAILIVAPPVWAWFDNQIKARRVAVGVQAGINMTVAGNALAADGVTVVSRNDGSTPPLPVTQATASQIVADFGPKPSSIAKA